MSNVIEHAIDKVKANFGRLVRPRDRRIQVQEGPPGQLGLREARHPLADVFENQTEFLILAEVG